jgi:hypothetical protein
MHLAKRFRKIVGHRFSSRHKRTCQVVRLTQGYEDSPAGIKSHFAD